MTHTKDEALKLAAEFDKRFTSMNGIDAPARVSVPRDEWRALHTAIKQALAAPVQEMTNIQRHEQNVQKFLAAQPALKDHETAQLVNRLTTIAKEFGQTQQLRERIAHELRATPPAAPVQPADIATLVEGMEVSIDVSTGDHDSGNRLFGTVTLAQENQGSKHGLILLVQDPEANFKTAAQPAPVQEPTHEALMAGYKVACEFGVYESNAFKLAEKMYAAMALAAQPAVPLTDEQIVETFCKAPHQTQYVAWFAAGVRYSEAHHGITEKGQP